MEHRLGHVNPVRHLHELGYTQFSDAPSVLHGACDTDWVVRLVTCTASVTHRPCVLMQDRSVHVGHARHLRQLGYAQFDDASSVMHGACDTNSVMRIEQL